MQILTLAGRRRRWYRTPICNFDGFFGFFICFVQTLTDVGESKKKWSMRIFSSMGPIEGRFERVLKFILANICLFLFGSNLYRWLKTSKKWSLQVYTSTERVRGRLNQMTLNANINYCGKRNLDIWHFDIWRDFW